MKKIIATILALMMVLSLVACGAGEEKKDPTNGGNTVENNETPAPAGPTDKELADAASVEEIAKALINKYAEFAGVRETYDQYMAEMPEEEQISYEEFLSYQMAVNPVDPEFQMGITEVVTGYSEGYVYQPMMMGTAFIGYIFRVEEGTDVENFKKFLTEKCDPRWNICTMANTTVCESFGDLVYFSMMVVADGEEYIDGFTAEQKDAFYNTFIETIKGSAN